MIMKLFQEKEKKKEKVRKERIEEPRLYHPQAQFLQSIGHSKTSDIKGQCPKLCPPIYLSLGGGGTPHLLMNISQT